MVLALARRRVQASWTAARQKRRMTVLESPREILKARGILRVSEDDKNGSGYDGVVMKEPLIYSTITMQGRRLEQEDRFAAVDPKLADSKFSFFGVFDGHGGDQCSSFLQERILPELASNPEKLESDTVSWIEERFMELDAEFCKLSEGKTSAGSTALVSIVERDEVSGLPHRLWVANTGDSRAVIVRKSGKVKAMNREHKPDLPDEAQRVMESGGLVSFGLDWRVDNALAMTRAFGNWKMKPYVTARPEVIERKLRKDDMYLCMASDGLWDTVQNEEVAEYLLAYGAQNGVNRLAQLAFDRKSWDNITVLAIRLNMTNDHLPF